jgi:hypothetical protein
MEILTFQEWLKTGEGQGIAVAVLASSSGMYPNTFEINRQLRIAYEDYKLRMKNGEHK